MIIGFSDFGSCGGFCDLLVLMIFGFLLILVVKVISEVLVIKVGFVLQSFRLFVIGLLIFRSFYLFVFLAFCVLPVCIIVSLPTVSPSLLPTMITINLCELLYYYRPVSLGRSL